MFFLKKFEKHENFSLQVGKLVIRYSGWLWPDDITMPFAQLREKAVFQYTTHPYLATGKYFERWKTQ
jgi:hypothetical protein